MLFNYKEKENEELRNKKNIFLYQLYCCIWFLGQGCLRFFKNENKNK